MAIQPTQPQSIGGVLDTTFQLYKASLVRVLPLCVLAVIAGSPTSIYMLTKLNRSANPLAVLEMMREPGYWGAALVATLASLWVLASLYLKIAAIGAGDDLGVGAALQRALGRVPVLFLTTILFVIAVAIGSVLVIVPGVILSVSLLLYFNLALFEGKGPIQSLTDSHRLVWGNWWRTTAVLTVAFIIVMVIYVAAGFLIGMLVPFIGIGSEDLQLASTVTGMVLGGLMSLLLTPFYVALIMAVYWDLKLRKEGGDLAARVGALNPA